MATTTNYGWTTPDNTALVKDGASAIRTLGSSVDTTVKALSPGTTAGDVDYYTSSTAKARLAIGSTGQVLTVAGGVPSWADAGASGATYSLLNAGGTALTGAQTITVSGISGIEKLRSMVMDATCASANSLLSFRVNTDAGSNYTYAGTYIDQPSGNDNWGAQKADTASSFIFARGGSTPTNASHGAIYIDGGKGTTGKNIQLNGSGGTGSRAYNISGLYLGSAVISSISIISGTGNFNGGTVFVYGSAA
jgi:hypothetical protein